MAGYDTANEIQNVYSSAHSEFGVSPNFWLRYFTPSPAADVVNSDPVSESRGAWDSGGPRIGCINEPSQSRLASGSTAEGQSDGQSFCAAVYSAYTSVGPLQLPTNGTLYCWLGQEASTSLTLNYWNGWARTVHDYVFAENGLSPLYPCLYCDPPAPPPNCTIIQDSSAVTCHAVWSSEPEPCTRSIANPPTWNADHCSVVPTKVWQYAEQGACGLSANVDLDMGAPNFNTANYCFYLSSRP